MPSSVRVGSRPPRSCLIFSNFSGVRPCSRISSGVMAIGTIAEVVIRESLLSHLHQLFACEFLGSGRPRPLPLILMLVLTVEPDSQLPRPKSTAAGEGACSTPH